MPPHLGGIRTSARTITSNTIIFLVYLCPYAFRGISVPGKRSRYRRTGPAGGPEDPNHYQGIAKALSYVPLMTSGSARRYLTAHQRWRSKPSQSQLIRYHAHKQERGHDVALNQIETTPPYFTQHLGRLHAGRDHWDIQSFGYRTDERCHRLYILPDQFSAVFRQISVQKLLHRPID